MWLTKNNKNFKRKNILIIIEHKYCNHIHKLNWKQIRDPLATRMCEVEVTLPPLLKWKKNSNKWQP